MAVTLLRLAVLTLLVCQALAAYNQTSFSIRDDGGFDYHLQLINATSPTKRDTQRLVASVYFEADDRIRLIIRDEDSDRWEVPPFLRPTDSDSDTSSGSDGNSVSDALYVWDILDQQWGFIVTRRTSNRHLLYSESLTYSDQYIELVTSMPSDSQLYGLGERAASMPLSDGVYTLWNSDEGTRADGSPMYGSHPSYWGLEPSGECHALILYNSNQMDVNVSDGTVTFRTTGGILDLTLVLGPTPSAVASQYAEVVGKPFMPPIWSLGFHTSRWGIRDLNYSRVMVQQYAAHGFPLDAMWHDIDYMSYYFGFTFDTARYPVTELRNFNDWLKSQHIQHVYIVDPGIPTLIQSATVSSATEPYYPYVSGAERNVFIRHPANDTWLFTCAWPSVPVVFGDFTHPNASQWWTDTISQWSAGVGLPDGLWLDMNEVSSFVDGELRYNSSLSCQHYLYNGPKWSNISQATNFSYVRDIEAVAHPPVMSVTDIPMPPYLPGNIDPNARSLNISSHLYLSQYYNLHNLYGQLEQRATQQALQSLNNGTKRSFTLSRASFLGSGQYGAVWTGDHNGTFADLRTQLPMLLSMGLHGVSMIGTDLCGIGRLTVNLETMNLDTETCVRWFQLGAFLPLMRLHYQDFHASNHREPYAYDDCAQSMIRRAMLARYALLPYLYSLFIDSHLYGYPILRTMFYEFVGDRNTWSIETQAMVGPALLVAPVYETDVNARAVYVPNSHWYDWFTHTTVMTYNDSISVGQTLSLPAQYECNGTIPVLVRGGAIVPTQSPNFTTYDTLLSHYTLTIALDHTGTAYGRLMIDDGQSLTNVDSGNYHLLAFNASFNVSDSANIIHGMINMTGFNDSVSIIDIGDRRIQRIIVLGLPLASSDSAESLNVTLGGGSAGDGCVSLDTNATQIRVVNGTVHLVDVNATLLVLTSDWILSFNDGCIIPPQPSTDDEPSALLPLAILVVFVLVILGGLTWFRTRSQPATEAEQLPIATKSRRRTGRRKKDVDDLSEDLLVSEMSEDDQI